LIVAALREKLDILMIKEYLDRRAGRASRQKFERVLGKVADCEPIEDDRL
jgi:hypothetical protein